MLRYDTWTVARGTAIEILQSTTHLQHDHSAQWDKFRSVFGVNDVNPAQRFDQVGPLEISGPHIPEHHKDRESG